VTDWSFEFQVPRSVEKLMELASPVVVCLVVFLFVDGAKSGFLTLQRAAQALKFSALMACAFMSDPMNCRIETTSIKNYARRSCCRILNNRCPRSLEKSGTRTFLISSIVGVLSSAYFLPLGSPRVIFLLGIGMSAP
jgi:hypothetical protein